MYLTKLGMVCLLLWSFSSNLLYAQSQNSIAGDRQALVDLYNATNGNNWKNDSGWLNGNPSGSWNGVEVNSSGRVVSLNLRGNNLSGSLPKSLGNLTKLRYFNVKQNKLTGQIPWAGIGRMTNLTHLLLNGRAVDPDPVSGAHHPGKDTKGKWSDERTNDFTGKLGPEIGNLVNLVQFELMGVNSDYTGLTGPIPTQIGNLKKLEGLYLDYNSLNSLPESMKNLIYLRQFSIISNSLQGDGFPTWVAKWTNLKFLWFEDNNLGGRIPNISNLVDLEILDISHNDFVGEIPSYLFNGTMPHINLVNLAFNELTGSLPEFGTPNNLKALQVGSNNLTGKIPASIRNVPKMINLSLGWNNFEGEIPDLSHMYQLRYIRANDNNFTGTVPMVDTSNEKLKFLHFQNNRMSGKIPAELAQVANLPLFGSSELKIYNNHFSQSDIQPLIDALNAGGNLNILSSGGQNPSGGGSEESSRPGIPALNFPKDGADAQPLTLTLDWEYINGADTYQLQVASDGNFNSKIIDRGGLTSSSDKVSGLGNSKTYYWRVRASNQAGSSSWSGVRSFTTESDGSGNSSSSSNAESPSLIFPSNKETDVSTTPELKWSSVEGADYYILHSNRLDPSAMVIEAEVEGTSFIPDGVGLDSQTRHHWRVRAVKDGVEGEWSSIHEFTTQSSDNGAGAGAPPSPVLSSPSNNAGDVSLTPTFEWGAVDADHYILQVNSESLSGVIETEVAGMVYTSGEELEAGTSYSWRVRAVKDGVEGEWSSIHEFTTKSSDNGAGAGAPPSPVLSSPSNNAGNVSLTPTFEWGAVDADHYILQVNSESLSGVIETEVAGTVYTTGEVLEGTTSYSWRVQAVKGGVKGEWSSTREFTTGNSNNSDDKPETPDIPALNYPEADAGDVSLTPTFRWRAVDADYYILQVNSESLSGVIETEVAGMVYTTDKKLEAGTSYSWRVQAVKDGVKGEWSPERDFTTGSGTEKITTSLGRNYPNPFNPSTQIRFNLDKTQKVSLKVYDTLGRVVATLVDGTLSAGTYERTFRADNLASGVYFYRFVTEARVFTNQMTLMK